MIIKSTLPKPKWIIALGIPLLIALACVSITFLPVYRLHKSVLSNGILADLLFSAPLIYFLAIRKTNVSRITVIRFFVVCLFFAGFLLRSDVNSVVLFLKTWISPALELFVLVTLIRKFQTARKIAAVKSEGDIDFLMYCRAIMPEVTGSEKIGNLFASEIAVIYYALFGWRAKQVDYTSNFSSHKQNGILTVFYALLFIFLIETTGMHFVFRRWNDLLAWILTGLSLYTCLQLFAHIRAVKARPITINQQSLLVRNGLAGEARIDFKNIKSIECSKKTPPNGNFIKIALLKGLENHNIIVYLAAPIEVTKIFGIKRTTATVLFFVDRPQTFVEIIEKNMV